MEYSNDPKNNYIDGLRQSGNASAPGAFSASSNNRLGGMLDLQYQQQQQQQPRRLNSNSFDNSSYTAVGQGQLSAQTPTYNMNGGAPGLLNDSSYGSLSLGTYDSAGVDWNASSRAVGAVGSLGNNTPTGGNSRGAYSLPQSSNNNSFFPSQTGSSDWSGSLRAPEPLGLQSTNTGFGIGDLQGNMGGLSHLSPQPNMYGQSTTPNNRGGAPFELERICNCLCSDSSGEKWLHSQSVPAQSRYGRLQCSRPGTEQDASGYPA
jgi:hypothetical protein